MAEAATVLKWGVEQRLEFIEFRLFWEGSINRAALVETFGVSVPQASKDLTLYQERAPGNMEYDTRAKRYVAAEKFVLRFLEPDPYIYLSQLRSVAEGGCARGRLVDRGASQRRCGADPQAGHRHQGSAEDSRREPGGRLSRRLLSVDEQVAA